VTPASAELLPPTTNDGIDDQPAESKPTGRMHGEPQF
jgi:hypothetical protein